MARKISMSEKEWQKKLKQIQYLVARKKHTEKPFTGKYWNCTKPGVYRCVCCGLELFPSASKFDAGCGWPSFTKPVNEENLGKVADHSHGMIRTEVICSQCDAHLGHLFEDGPEPEGLRYCINSASLYLDEETPSEEAEETARLDIEDIESLAGEVDFDELLDDGNDDTP